MTLRIAVLASGTGSNLDSLLAKSANGLLDAKVTLVVTDKPGAPCLDKARRAGVPALVELPADKGEKRAEYDARLIDAIAAEAPDAIILAGFMRILSPAFIDAFAGRIINIHPALLPKHKGAHGIRDTISAGDEIAGCTTHFVTAELDGGPMILQASLPVNNDDQPTLAARVLKLEHQLLPRTVQLLAEGRIEIARLDPARPGFAAIADGPSWQADLQPVPDASYSPGF